ncbi:type II toxin-antitoxin system VapC family toxin [Glycomyces halotolerans]
MIAVDTNILVYTHRSDSPFHQAADHVIRELAEGNRLWTLPWPCLHEFYNIVTHPTIHRDPTPDEVALEQIDAWIASPSAALLSESAGYWSRLRPMLRSSRVVGPKVHDARIAALCVENGIDELWTQDRDFSRFPVLKTRNPLTD